jgi:hypothetical protein
MDKLPSSAYQMLYDEELKKIKDVKNKTAEIQIWENEVISLFLSKKRN